MSRGVASTSLAPRRWHGQGVLAVSFGSARMPGELASAQARIVELEAALAESTRQREKLQHKVARLDEQSF